MTPTDASTVAAAGDNEQSINRCWQLNCFISSASPDDSCYVFVLIIWLSLPAIVVQEA